MPRFFSLSHPLYEMCPILHKSHVGTVNYITEAEYRIVFSTPDNDLVLMYDNKIGKHFVARLRKATEDEILAVSGKIYIEIYPERFRDILFFRHK